MVSGIWRRIRSIVGGEAPAGQSQRFRPNLPHAPERPAAAPEPAPAEPGPVDLGYRPTPVPAESPPRPLEELAESYSTRLVEDETLRGNLTDDEYQPLLDWAQRRLGELATNCARLPAAAVSGTFSRAGDQLFNLLRLVDLAVGQRAGASPELVMSRFQMLDTLLEPPLLDEAAAGLARGRLEALLAEPPERLQSADGAELARRLADALG